MALNAAEIRASLDHPVVDADGHWLEFVPAITEDLERIGGPTAAEGFSKIVGRVESALKMSVDDRKQRRIAQQCWWGYPTVRAIDRATSIMPKLLYERLDEFGIDFAVLFPTNGLGIVMLGNPEQRRATCRAFNTYCAEHFGPFADRITPAAVIPMHTPDEAIEELEYVRNELGLKAVCMSSLVRRPIPAIADDTDAGRSAVWLDTLGLDSEYDYDPVWQACADLGVSPTFHMGTRGFGLRVSPTNFTYNHIGHFAVASEAVCKALFLGGVTRRFPQVNFGFLEGGVAWACNLFGDLIGHWEKRNLDAMENTNPANIEWAAFEELAEKYGDPAVVAAIKNRSGLDRAEGSVEFGGIEELDDYASCKISSAQDIKELFCEPFYFGCEADDPLNAWGFNTQTNPLNARLKTLFGSDIGHFDVIDMAGVLPEAYELVEDNLITSADFADFVFENPVRFWGEANPEFFRGTSIEAEAAALLAP